MCVCLIGGGIGIVLFLIPRLGFFFSRFYSFSFLMVIYSFSPSDEMKSPSDEMKSPSDEMKSSGDETKMFLSLLGRVQILLPCF